MPNIFVKQTKPDGNPIASAMNIGIIKESGKENRVVMLPEILSSLLQKNIRVLVEKDAGKRAFAGNDEYQEAGAAVENRDTVLKDADILLMIHPPEDKDLDKLKEGQVLVGVFNPLMKPGLVRKLNGKKLTVFSMDILPRTSRAQSMDILSSQATVAGYKAVLESAYRSPNFFPMFMSAAGTIRPSKVLIMGAGVAGLQAIAIARKLGAVVEVFDVRSAAKEEVMSLGGKFVEVEGSMDDDSAGGYAVEQTEEYKKKQQEAIHEHAIKSNVIICTAQIPGKKAPLLLRKETLDKMRPGSVVVDLAASSGGNCEVSQNGKIIEYRGIQVIGNSVYPSETPSDSSKMFGKNILNFINLMFDDEGTFSLNFDDDLIRGTCVCHNNKIINEKVREMIH